MNYKPSCYDLTDYTQCYETDADPGYSTGHTHTVKMIPLVAVFTDLFNPFTSLVADNISAIS